MSQRDRLLNRKRPSVPYKLLVDDDTAAVKDLQEAETELELAQMDEREADAEAKADAKAEVKRARARVEKAKKALDACYETITLRAMRPPDFEEFVKDHPAREGKDEAYNMDTLPRALFFECVESEMSREDWEIFLAENASFGETESINGMYMAALYINGRTPNGAVGKG